MVTDDNTSVLRMSLEGTFEDAFLYMGQLIAVRSDKLLVQADLERLVQAAFMSPEVHAVAQMFLLRNDMLGDSGTMRLLSLRGVQERIASLVMSKPLQFDADRWVETDNFERILPRGEVLDMQVYAQRLYMATTQGMLSANLVDAENSVRLNPADKRTDARCIAVTVRYGSVVASLGDEGMLIFTDDFGQSDQKPRMKTFAADPSLRASWLGYHLVNYSRPNYAHSFRSSYEQVDPRTTVITDVRSDESLISAERDSWTQATFSFNDYNTFFTRYVDGTYQVRQRLWHSGQLGRSLSSYEGVMSQPISAHRCDAGLVVETYDRVYLVTQSSVTVLYEGEAVAVRTFPNSRHYKNLVMIVGNDELQLISPVAPRSATFA